MTALEIRQDEIGSFDYEAYKARRARMMSVKPPQPKPSQVRIKPVASFGHFTWRSIHPSDRTLYASPIGPIRVRDVLNIASPKHSAHKSAKSILAEICAQYAVSHVDLISDRRTACLVRPRQHACWRLRHETTLSLPQIGRLMGGRDHTTVLYAVRKYEAQRDAGKLVMAAE